MPLISIPMKTLLWQKFHFSSMVPFPNLLYGWFINTIILDWQSRLHDTYYGPDGQYSLLINMRFLCIQIHKSLPLLFRFELSRRFNYKFNSPLFSPVKTTTKLWSTSQVVNTLLFQWNSWKCIQPLVKWVSQICMLILHNQFFNLGVKIWKSLHLDVGASTSVSILTTYTAIGKHFKNCFTKSWWSIWEIFDWKKLVSYIMLLYV